MWREKKEQREEREKEGERERRMKEKDFRFSSQTAAPATINL